MTSTYLKEISKFWTTLTSVLVELEFPPKVQNIGSCFGYHFVILYFRYNSQLECSPRPQDSPGPQNEGHFENVGKFHLGLFWRQICEDQHKIYKKRIFTLMTPVLKSQWGHSQSTWLFTPFPHARAIHNFNSFYGQCENDFELNSTSILFITTIIINKSRVTRA